jgi:ketosteroid isomerase-like protein
MRAHLAFCLPVFVLSSIAAQQHTGSIQDQIREVYRDYNEAVRRMDSAKYMSFIDPEFQMISPDGKTHSAAEMKEYSGSMLRLQRG